MTRRALLLACLAAVASACAPRADNAKINLPQPVENTTVGPSDVFTLQIVGEKDLPTVFQIDSQGNVDLPYIHRLQVGGLEPQEIAALVRERLIAGGVLRDPSVIVRVEQYNSKHVTVLGQVQKPGSFPFTTGITLIQVVSQAGGLNAVANPNWVNLTRKTKNGSKSVVVSIGAIMEGRSPDILLQAGDQIYVRERVF